MAQLVPTRPGGGECLVFGDGIHRLGRASDNDLVVTHRSLSLHHARLCISDDAASLEDLGSTNGTFVNGKRVERHALHGGERVRLGSVEFRFELAEGSLHPLLVQQPAEASTRPLRDLLSRPHARRGPRATDELDDAERTRYKLQILIESTRLLGSPMPIDRLLREILDLLFQILDVDHAMVLMAGAGGELEPRVTRSRTRADESADAFSRNVVRFVQQRGVAAVFADTRHDPRLEHAETLHHLSIRSCMCAPLKPKDSVLGVLYVSHATAADRFGRADLEFLSAFANQAAVALESSLAFEEIQRMNDGLERQVDERTAELSRALQELERAQGQLVESEKQAMLGRLVAGIVHETNTPLGVLRSTTATLTRVLESTGRFVRERARAGDADAAALIRSLDAASSLEVTLGDALSRLQGLVTTLKRFVSLDDTEPKPFDVREGLDAALRLLGPQIAPGVSIVRAYADDVSPVTCDPGRLSRSLSNVLLNALTAVAGRGTVALRASMRGDEVDVEIEDDGLGMTAAQVARAFDFTFIQKGGRMRMALGLPTLKKVVDDLGGRVAIESELGRGTRVRITLPTSAPKA